jgi:hypothetical protein
LFVISYAGYKLHMNIFFLDKCPTAAAQMLCDKHIGKMQLEAAQMLCTAAKLKYDLSTKYKPTHVNHPSSVWCRGSEGNLLWLKQYVLAMDEEWLLRKGLKNEPRRSHASHAVSLEVLDQMLAIGTRTKQMSYVPLCMPEDLCAGSTKHVPLDVAVSYYRSYYIRDKAKFATWPESRVPLWWPTVN